MSTDNNDEIAQRMLRFQIEMANWTKCNIMNEFNINGKGKNNLTIRQFHIMLIVHKIGINQVSAMEKCLGISKSSLSLTLAKMVHEGYLKRVSPTSSDDGRKVYFVLTETGESILNTIRDKVIQRLGDFYQQLDEERQNKLEQGITLLEEIFISPMVK